MPIPAPRRVHLLDLEGGEAVLHRDCSIQWNAGGELLRVEPSTVARETPVDEHGGFEFLLPGLVNPHCHLELTELEGEIPSTPSFVEWGRRIFPFKRERQSELFEGAKRGVALSLAAGVTAIGDITTCLAGPLALKESPLRGISFVEIIAIAAGERAAEGLKYFRHLLAEVEKLYADVGPRLRAGVSPHAPHTVIPQVMEEVGHAEAATRRPTIHVAETIAEIEYLMEGAGEFRSFFTEVGLIGHDWEHVGETPANCCDYGDLLPPRDAPYVPASLRERAAGKATPYAADTVLAHGNYLTAEEIAWLKDRRVAVCWCPETHKFFQHAHWPADRNRALPVLLGTDSLASAWSLDPLDQLALALEKIDADPAASPWPVADLLQAVTLRARDCLFGRGAAHPDADFTRLRATGELARALASAPSGEPMPNATLRDLFSIANRPSLRPVASIIGGATRGAAPYRLAGAKRPR